MKSQLTKEFAADVAQRAVKRGASTAEVVIRQRTEFSVGIRLGEVETLKESTDQGLGLRVLIDGKQSSVSGSDLSQDAVTSLIEEAVELARLTSPDDTAGLPDTQELASSIPNLDLYDEAIEKLSTEDQIEMALRAERAAQAYSEQIINSDGGGFESAHGSLILANSLGFAGEYRATSCSLTAVPVAVENGKMQRDYWYDERRRLDELDSPEEIGVMAAKRTLRKLGGKAVPTQSVPVVLEPNMARDLLGDVFNAASGEAIFRKASFLVGQLGERIASDRLTVIDDGTIPRKLGSRPFDGEGLPVRRTVVVDQGTLRSYLLDTYSGRKLGLPSTHHGARDGSGVSVSTTNLYLAAGDRDPGDLIRSVKNGLYVTELIGFGVNGVTGDYSRGAVGMWIENGELAYPVEEITVAGNLLDMLHAVEGVGNDLVFRDRTAAPTLLIGRMTVAGD